METLEIYLADSLVGTITRLPDDRNVFSFDEAYRFDEKRPTLSLSYKDVYSNLITDI